MNRGPWIIAVNSIFLYTHYNKFKSLLNLIRVYKNYVSSLLGCRDFRACIFKTNDLARKTVDTIFVENFTGFKINSIHFHRRTNRKGDIDKNVDQIMCIFTLSRRSSVYLQNEQSDEKNCSNFFCGKFYGLEKRFHSFFT